MNDKPQQLKYASKRKSYDAGVRAKATGGSRDHVVNGWGHRKSAYREWYLDGFDGKPFQAIRTAEPEPYAMSKARKLIAAAYQEAGRHACAEQYLNPEYRTTALLAFARYIESVE